MQCFLSYWCQRQFYLQFLSYVGSLAPIIKSNNTRTGTVEFPTENAKVWVVCKSTLVLLRVAVVKVVCGCDGDVPPGFCAVNLA